MAMYCVQSGNNRSGRRRLYCTFAYSSVCILSLWGFWVAEDVVLRVCLVYPASVVVG